jgi:hypothetical protein
MRAEVIEILLTRGIIIEALMPVFISGLQIISIETRVVIATLETYLRYAEAIGRTGTARKRVRATPVQW